MVPRGRPDTAARHLPRHRPLRLGPEGDAVQRLHDRHRQPGAQRHRLRDGPAARRPGRRVRAGGRGPERGHHRLLRGRRHQPGRRARGHGVRGGLRRARGLLLPEQPVGDLRAGGQAVAGAAVGAVHRLRVPRRPGRRQRRAGLPGGHQVGAGGVPVGQRPGDDRGVHLPDGRAHHVRRPDTLSAGRRGRALEAARPDRAGAGAPVPAGPGRPGLLRRGRARRQTSWRPGSAPTAMP